MIALKFGTLNFKSHAFADSIVFWKTFVNSVFRDPNPNVIEDDVLMPSPKSFLEDERCFRLRVLCFVVLVLLVVLMILEVFFEGCDVSVDSDVVGGCVNLLRLFCVLS